MDGSPGVGRGALSMSPTSPASSRHGNGMPKRKRSGGMGLESSPGSINEDDHGDHNDNDKKRQPGVKRACNECRQQKVSQPLRPWHLPSVLRSPHYARPVLANTRGAWGSRPFCCYILFCPDPPCSAMAGAVGN